MSKNFTGRASYSTQCHDLKPTDDSCTSSLAPPNGKSLPYQLPLDVHMNERRLSPKLKSIKLPMSKMNNTSVYIPRKINENQWSAIPRGSNMKSGDKFHIPG